MTDILEMLDELKELKTLYETGDLRLVDLEDKIQKYESQMNRFEQDLEQQMLDFM